ncbi:helix-turn-helix domain-containing protein [Ruminococcus flavefaciens]|uniref:helix-turn-helix domain-containing protein n=1 Tax=Ruminococcus flavefaciens TaxID=1265 RepID=UPI0026F22F29|nr:helix-turn-helix transcriptional regulator [Ruminococcus flavefaciens]
MNEKSKKKENEITLSEKLSDLRIDKNLSIDKLCKEVSKRGDFELTKSSYQRMEADTKDEQNCGYKAIKALAKFYNVSADYLLGLTGYRPIHMNIEKREMVDIIGYDNKTLRALLFWSKNKGLKEMKEVVSEIIKGISIDLIKASSMIYQE